MKQPDGDGAGRRVHAPVQHIDLLPTVLDLVRAPIPGGLRGRSLRPVLDDSDETVPMRPIYAESLAARYRFGGRPVVSRSPSDGARLLRDGADTLVTLDSADLPNPDAGRARRGGAQRRARSAAGPARRRRPRPRCPRRRRALRAARRPDGRQPICQQPGRRAAGRIRPRCSTPTAAPRGSWAARQFGAAAAGLRELARANPQVPALQVQLGTLLERARPPRRSRRRVHRGRSHLARTACRVTLALSHALARAGSWIRRSRRPTPPWC